MRNLLVIVSFLVYAISLFGQFPSGFAAISVMKDLDPTSMSLAPNGDIFLTEKNGIVWVIRNGEVLPLPFIELEVDNFNERGLSGVATHPDYPNTPYVYFYYTVPEENRNRVIRVKAVNDQAIPASIETILDLDPIPGTIHNGGGLLFGTDGMLYIAVGDGAAFQQVQTLETFLGKILRVHPDGSIPIDNPFYNEAVGDYRAIWAIGLRNPFTFTVQNGTGVIASGDVGSDKFEEINIIEKGKNYGWPLSEGNWQNGTQPANYKDPLLAYDRNFGCSITGAAFYSPEIYSFPDQYKDRLFFGDYCKGRIWDFDPINGGEPVVFALGLNRPLSLLTHTDGSMYVITRGGMGGGSMEDNTSSNNGQLWHIIYNPSGEPLVATQPTDVLVSSGDTARFYIKAAGNPIFSYQWSKDGIDIFGAISDTLIIPNATVVDSGAVIKCVISNTKGSVSSKGAILRVTDGMRPVANIITPLVGKKYFAGETITFSGEGTDAEEGTLEASAMSWRVDFHHDEHAHPFEPLTSGISQGSFTIPQVGETAHNVWYRLHLYVRDASGLRDQKFIDIFPNKTTINYDTEPFGLPLILDGQSITTPRVDSSVVGIIRSLIAPGLVENNGTRYIFDQWSDGVLTPKRDIETPSEPLQILAKYKVLQKGTGTGLLGLYYNKDTGTFTKEVTAWRIDPELNFYWQGSPYSPQIDGDDFAVRWLGEIEAWASGYYTFYLTGDDGVRLFINEVNVIDSWVDSDSGVRVTEPIYLEEGEKYPIKVELYERGGNAGVKLQWDFGDGTRILVPMSQLYPDPSFSSAEDVKEIEGIKLRVVPNPFSGEGIVEVFTSKSINIDIEVTNISGQVVNQFKWTPDGGFSQHSLGLSNLPSGVYLIKVNAKSEQVVLKVEKI